MLQNINWNIPLYWTPHSQRHHCHQVYQCLGGSFLYEHNIIYRCSSASLPGNATTEAFQLHDFSSWSPLNLVKHSILNQFVTAHCQQATICWPTVTNTAQNSCILCYTCRTAANIQMQPRTLCLTVLWCDFEPASGPSYSHFSAFQLCQCSVTLRRWMNQGSPAVAEQMERACLKVLILRICTCAECCCIKGLK